MHRTVLFLTSLGSVVAGSACGDGMQDISLDAAPELDASAPDAFEPFVPPAGCDYLDGASDQLTMWCAGEWTTIVGFTSAPADPACPPFYTRDGVAYADQAQAVDQLDCSLACVFTPRIAAQFIYCDVRGEFIGWAGDGPMQLAPEGTCGQLIYAESLAGAGWSDSLEAYQASHPCPAP